MSDCCGSGLLEPAGEASSFEVGVRARDSLEPSDGLPDSQDLSLLASLVDPGCHQIEMASRQLQRSAIPAQPNPVPAVIFGGENEQAHRKRSRRICRRAGSRRLQIPSRIPARPVEPVCRQGRGRVTLGAGVPAPIGPWRPQHLTADDARRIDHREFHAMVQLHQEPRRLEGHDSRRRNARPGGRGRSAGPLRSRAIGPPPSLRSTLESARLRDHEEQPR